MYSITVVNSSGEHTIHNTYDDTIKVMNPKLDLELNKSGTLTFDIARDNPNKGQIWPMASEIYVYRDRTVYWIGRPISVEKGFNMVESVTCEGVLGYLLDTQVPPFDFTEQYSIKGADCVETFLQRLITRHNESLSTSWADQRKKFTLGEVTIIDSNANLARWSEDYSTTLETINQKLLESYGGFIRVRYSGTTRYIDYIDTFGSASQPISFGENLLDLSTHVKTEEIATNVIPLGAQLDDSDQRITLSGYTPSTTVKNKISGFTHGGAIRTVNKAGSLNGFVGIYDKQGEDSHGRVYTVKTWDDVTKKENLALKAAEYIGTISVLGETLDLSAIDLAQIDIDYRSFNIGEIASVISIPHGINAEYQITQMTVDLYNPANSTLTLGGELKTFTFDNTKKTAEVVEQLTGEISSAVLNATALLSGGKGGYLIIRQNEDTGQPEEILIMNAATEVSATNCVRINRNGIGFGKKSSGQTAEAWVYRNAWTIDGNLVADFITSGTLNARLLKTGTIQDQQGNTSINLSNGMFSMKKGSINLGNGKFSVNDNGYLTTKNGKIGGWTISANGLSGNSVNDLTFDIYAPTSRSDSVIMASANGLVSFDVQANGYTYISPVDNTGTGGNIRFVAGTNGCYMSNATSGAEVRVNNSGLTLVTGRQTTSHSGNLYISSNGVAYYGIEAVSSRKNKTDIKEVEKEELMPERLYDADVIQYKYKDDFLSEDDDNRGKDLVGFIVEDLDEVYPAAVQKETEDSKTWTWSPYRIIPPMMKLIQDQKKEIDSLKEEVEEMSARIDKLEQMIMKGESDG